VITDVGIALVLHEGCYLVGHRGPDGPLAGFHEFPGGKCDSGEAPADCAVRECLEETGLAIEIVRLRRTVEHTYPYGSVRLHFFDCRLEPAAGSAPPAAFAWVPQVKLRELRFPEPNGPLIAELAGSPTACSDGSSQA
jgi:mutator protein MutT